MEMVVNGDIQEQAMTILMRLGEINSSYLRCKCMARKRSTPIRNTVANDSVVKKAPKVENTIRTSLIFSQVNSS